MRKLISSVGALLAVCLLFSMFSCRGGGSVREEIYFGYFDTVCTVKSYADESEEDFAENCIEIEKILQKYHRLLDIYNEYDGESNLCTLNENAGGEPVEVARELVDFMLYAKEIHGKTRGELNIMMGAVLSEWRGFRDHAALSPDTAEPPSADTLAGLAQHTSIELLEIDSPACTLRISDPEASVDVGALGKGYVAQKIAQYLRDKGISGYVIDLGGNLCIVGEKPSGEGWITGVRDPFDAEGYAIKLKLSDVSCVTSGDYERYFEQDGKIYHHIIDKDTLYPAEHFASVTVICRDSALADALSTALFCMSLEEGRALVASLDGVEAVWVGKNGDVTASEKIESVRVD